MRDYTAGAMTRVDGFFTVAAFCQWSGLGRTKVYDLIKQGDLRALKCGRRTLITEAEAARWRDALSPLRTTSPSSVSQSSPISGPSARAMAGTTVRMQR